jgi:hypothetical protein
MAALLLNERHDGLLQLPRATLGCPHAVFARFCPAGTRLCRERFCSDGRFRELPDVFDSVAHDDLQHELFLEQQ